MKRIISNLTIAIIAVVMGGFGVQPGLAQDTVLKPEAQSVVDALDMTPVIGEYGKSIAFAVFVWAGQTEDDRVYKALQEIRGRLDELDSRLKRLETRVPYELVRTQNQSRLDRLRDYSRKVRELTLDIGSPPTTRAQRKVLVDKAAILADAFSDDSEFGRFWEWSAVEADDRVLSEDFSPTPGLTIYNAALNAWIAALEVYSEGDSALVRAYGPALRRHAQFIATLPSKTSERISCEFSNIRFTPGDPTGRGNVTCSAQTRCYDRISKGWLEGPEVTAPGITDSINASCQAVFQMNDTLRGVLSDSKTLIETQYGVTQMREWATFLNQYATTGVLRQFIGTFGKTPTNYQPMWVYAIKNDGDMLWYRKDSGESPWQGPKKVSQGWNFKDVIPAGGNSFYALTAEGKLLWYRHDGFNDGSPRNWAVPVEVGQGWNFRKIFSGGEGIVYAIKEDGDLLWYRHGGYADGGGIATWNGPKSVGAQWNVHKDVFSNGGGDIYAITPAGELVYYHQPGYAIGERRFLPARTLATGWQNFRQIVPAGGGVILAIKEDGKLVWYRHYFKAPNRYGRVKEYWEGPVEIGSEWLGFKKVVALLPITASAPVVR